MQIRRGTATAWATADPTLVAGELGFVTDAGKTAFKIGDGTNPWTTLPYVNSTYTELPVDAGNNLDTAIVQGRYPLLTGVTYTNAPPAADFNGTTTDGSSILLVTVPSSTIVIQELTTSLTPCKRFIRARATTSAWTAWKRLDTLSATESLSITNLTLTGTLTVPAGAVGTPSLTFTGDTNTGVYSTGADNVSVTVAGTNRLSVGTGSPNITATGTMTVTSTLTASNALTVSAGTTALKATNIDGALSVVSTTPANQLSVGSITSALCQTVIKQNAYPTVGIFGRNPADASGLLFATYDSSGTAKTTIRSDGVPTAITDLTTKSYVDDAVIAGSNSVIVNANAWVVTTTIPTGPTNYVINISTQLLGVEYVYFWSQGAYGTTGGARVANLQITTNAGIYAQFKGGVRQGAGTGVNTAVFPFNDGGYVFQPSLTYTVATITIAATSGGAVPNINTGYITIKRIV